MRMKKGIRKEEIYEKIDSNVKRERKRGCVAWREGKRKRGQGLVKKRGQLGGWER